MVINQLIQDRTTILQLSPKPSTRPWSVAFLTLALLFDAYLAWGALNHHTVAGCSAASGCQTVLTSRWAWWFGIPVSLLALPCYFGLILSTSGKWGNPWRKDFFAWTILLAAGWFIFLQSLVLKTVCGYCLATHAAACVGAVLVLKYREPDPDPTASLATSFPQNIFRKPAALALALLFALAGGQLVHRPATNLVRIVESENGIAAANHPGRTLEIHGQPFNLDDLPLFGSPQATQFVACLFDYTCPHCRKTHATLGQALKTYGNQIAFVCLPVPMERQCNRFIDQTTAMHRQACDYARLGMAVWKCDPAAFPQFNEWFFKPESPPSLAQARQYADHLVKQAALAEILAGPWPDQQISRGLTLFEMNYRMAKQDELPQLIVGPSVSFGEIAEPAVLFRMLEERLHVKTPP